MAPASGPSARHAHAMASLGGDQVLLFGGFAADGRSGETWLAAGFFSYHAYLPLVAR
jgi:hypothetical protein